jgi:hypothetical protein
MVQVHLGPGRNSGIGLMQTILFFESLLGLSG